jgi:hypothetical protein
VIGARVNKGSKILTPRSRPDEPNRHYGAEQRFDEEVTSLDTLLLEVRKYPRKRSRRQFGATRGPPIRPRPRSAP